MLILSIFISFLLIFGGSIYIFHKWEEVSMNNLKATNLKNRMEISYIGKVSDIKYNLDMWCTYVYYLQRKYNILPTDEIEVSFAMKEGLNKDKVCKKFWRENDKSPYNLDSFIDENFIVNFSKK